MSAEIEDKVQRAAREIGEWVDSVEMIVTWKNGETSRSYCFGVGCIYSRIGATRDWLIRMEEDERQRVRSENR